MIMLILGKAKIAKEQFYSEKKAMSGNVKILKLNMEIKIKNNKLIPFRINDEKL